MTHPTEPDRTATQTATEAQTLDIAEERLRVAKREVDSGGVRVSTEVETVDEAVAVALRQQAAAVERVPMDRIVETAPEPRLEGDTIVIPVIEERPVVTTQLVVTEEIRVRLTEETRTEERTVPLRRERVTIDQIPPSIPSGDGDAPVSPPDGDAPAH